MFPLLLPLDHPDASLSRVGGKGASLARLSRNGLPVPRGFHVPTDVYRRFVEEAGLKPKILAALSSAPADRPAALEASSRTITSLFADLPMPEEAARAILEAYAALGENVAVAVRSSATAEDLPGMSFAGQQETYLNIRGGERLLDAVKRCWASLWTARAIQYRARHGIDQASVLLAVVVQALVPADASGVLFTADPVTGARDRMHINASFGLGEAIVGGDVSPDAIVVDKKKWSIEKQSIAAKTVMTVLVEEGTATQSVPLDKREVAVLGESEVLELARLGARIEELWAAPMDIEWARADGRFYILQARPITGPAAEAHAPLTWNDSLDGDYLWTSANLGEAIPDVMTPCTWSIVQRFMADAMFAERIAGHRLYGNIGGRFYMNMSVMTSMAAAFGMQKKLDEASTQVFGRLPAGMKTPTIPISRWRLLREVVPAAFRAKWHISANQKQLPAFLRGAPARAEALREAIRKTTSGVELRDLWNEQIEPFFRKASQMLQAAGKQDGTALVHMKQEMRERVGEADANALLTGLHGEGSELASLGPLLGLVKVAQGEISRDAYARLYGHRGAHEFEISMPRPAEDPDWIDKQLEGLRRAKDDPTVLLARQDAARRAAWERLEKGAPREVLGLRRKVLRWAAVARDREDARSESIRCFWLARAFVLRAGELTGRGADLFFSTIDEILALLGGDEASLASIPSRRATYERYAALPTYPTLIRGRFDPFQWARDPQRRSDVFDATAAAPLSGDDVTGFPGARGVVTGLVRVLRSPEEGEALETGEILVTTVTNIGWTPLFPRAAAVVTDVGAPLSHAAIVARELGIPAVVGCGDATMRLHTGDSVRVDGERGVVSILKRAEGRA